MGVYKLQQLLVGDEASFAEFAMAPASATFDACLPTIGGATLELMQDREPDGSAQARLSVEARGHKGPRTARLRFKTYWVGHLTAPTGALVESWQQRLLGDGLGGNGLSSSGDTIASAASASVVTLTDASDWAAGMVGRVGAKGDGRGDGQAFVVGSKATHTLTNLVALPGTPNAADVVYAAALAYHVEGATLQTKRFCCLHADTGAQIFLFGAQLAGVEFDIPTTGGKPTIEFTYEAAYWERAAKTFPDSTALGVADCAPVGGGSVFINALGTATRELITPESISLSLDMQLSPIIGPGGAGLYQQIVGWTRTAMKAVCTMSIPWTAAYETWWDAENHLMTNKHILATLNVVNGRSIGFYLPNVFPAGSRPTLPRNVNEQTYVDVTFSATEGPNTASDLTRSSVRLFAS
jgi:hypothetical protein